MAANPTGAHERPEPDDASTQAPTCTRQRRARSLVLRPVAIVAVLALLGAIAAACSDDDSDTTSADSADTPATAVHATEADGTITLDTDSSSSGAVQFTIRNDGELTHEFVVLKTDLAEDQLPLTSDGSTVDEDGDGVEEIGEREGITPGSEVELAFDDLASGTYVLICNVPGHYGLGMHTAFTVN